MMGVICMKAVRHIYGRGGDSDCFIRKITKTITDRSQGRVRVTKNASVDRIDILIFGALQYNNGTLRNIDSSPFCEFETPFGTTISQKRTLHANLSIFLRSFTAGINFNVIIMKLGYTKCPYQRPA